MNRAGMWRVLCLTVLSLLFTRTLGLTLQVEPRTTECVYQRFEAGETVHLEFLVTRGGLLDINVKLSNPSGAVIHEGLHFFQEGDEGVQRFTTTEAGIYAFCFDNEMSRWTAKVVTFDITASENTEAGSGESLKPLERSIRSMKSELNKITREQKYLRSREQVHRDTQESTFVRVYWFSTLESIVLVALSVFQIFFMKKWFETESSV